MAPRIENRSLTERPQVSMLPDAHCPRWERPDPRDGDLPKMTTMNVFEKAEQALLTLEFLAPDSVQAKSFRVRYDLARENYVPESLGVLVGELERVNSRLIKRSANPSGKRYL